jgi:hypothetical protein
MARRWWQLAPAVAAVVVALTSCGSSSSSTTPTTSGGAFAANLNPLGTARQAGAGQGPPTFAALPSPLGTYLATGFKLAVYINLNDSSSRVTCTGSCANTYLSSER